MHDGFKKLITITFQLLLLHKGWYIDLINKFKLFRCQPKYPILDILKIYQACHWITLAIERKQRASSLNGPLGDSLVLGFLDRVSSKDTCTCGGDVSCSCTSSVQVLCLVSVGFHVGYGSFVVWNFNPPKKIIGDR